MTWSIDKQKIIASVKVSPHGAEAHQVFLFYLIQVFIIITNKNIIIIIDFYLK